MKKIITFLAAIIISLFCLCACGTERVETTTDAGHIHAYGEWQTVREAGCVNAGERERTCDCGETETEEIPALGHTGGEATCKSRAKCERCGVTYGDYGPHIGGEATCKQRARCEVCMHPYGEVDPDNHKKILAATCVSKEKCRDCKKELGDSLDPSNHEKLEGKGLDKVCAGCKQTLLPETDASIVDSTNEKPIDFNEYLKKVTDDRVGRLSVPYKGQVESYVHSDKSKLLTPEEKNKYVAPPRPNVKPNATIVTREQAIEDVKICFKGFYTYYGPYEYFGADKFENAEKKAINAVNEFFDSGKKQIFDTELYDIIISSLDFIIDSHARLTCSSRGGLLTILNKKEYYSYCVKDIVFRKDDVGYYTLVSGNKWYLKDVNGGDFSEYLKVTIDESGELVYALVRIANPDAESLEGDTVTLKRGDTVCTIDIDWTMLGKFSGGSGETIWGTRVENGVPIIHIRSFNMDLYDAELTKYSASGSQFKNQKLFIVDLRRNSGGSTHYNANWVKNYIGNVEYSNVYGRVNFSSTVTELPLEEFVFKALNDNNRKIILIDKLVASSGEGAYMDFQSIRNTLIVGTNTWGCVLSGACVCVQLPNSTIVFRLGTNYFDMFNDYYNGRHPEGIGLMPDVFVNSTEALDLSMKMIEYYGIEKSKDTSGITTFGTGKR